MIIHWHEELDPDDLLEANPEDWQLHLHIEMVAVPQPEALGLTILVKPNYRPEPFPYASARVDQSEEIGDFLRRFLPPAWGETLRRN